MVEKKNAYRLLVGKPEGKRPLGRPRRRWVDNISMDLGEVGWGDMNWIDLAQDRNRRKALVKPVLNLRVPAVNLLRLPDTRRLRRFLPNDLPDRF
jgi:hypothetical protein